MRISQGDLPAITGPTTIMMDMIIMTVVIMTVMITTDTITTGIEVKDVGGAGYSPHRRDLPRWTRLLPRSQGLYNERMQLRRMNLYTVGLVAGLACGAVMPGSADPAPAEPTREACEAARARKIDATIDEARLEHGEAAKLELPVRRAVNARCKQ